MLTDNIAIVTIITMLSQVIKAAAPELKKQWIPLINVAIGMALAATAWFVGGMAEDIMQTLQQGIEYGLLACGMYSTAKNVTQTTRKEVTE